MQRPATAHINHLHPLLVQVSCIIPCILLFSWISSLSTCCPLLRQEMRERSYLFLSREPIFQEMESCYKLSSESWVHIPTTSLYKSPSTQPCFIALYQSKAAMDNHMLWHPIELHKLACTCLLMWSVLFKHESSDRVTTSFFCSNLCQLQKLQACMCSSAW